MKELVIIQPGYQGLEQIAFVDDYIKKTDSYLPLHMGSVEYIRNVWQAFDIDEPRPLGYPPELKQYFNRKIEHQYHCGWIKGDLFVKPYYPKKFDTFITYGEGEFASYPIEQRFEQEIVEFAQEYRVYCIGNTIVGHGRYDPLELDDLDIVDVYEFTKCIMNDWTDKPCAYAIDVGIIVGKGLSLVELTDAWAIGWYKPMSLEQYSKMLKLRWNEIVEN